MASIVNIVGYKFVSLVDLNDLRTFFLRETKRLLLKGTILLSPEGINLSLAGLPECINEFKQMIVKDQRFASFSFRETRVSFQPFNRMKVKLKKEIITLKQPPIQPELGIAPEITPKEFKTWLDEGREITILDTRNEYEVRFGTFAGAVSLKLSEFSEFPKAAHQVTRDKPIVMFCTGGIRCEKAAWVLLNDGYSEVYQLKGGILNYFAEVGGDHYNGECFVFDQRIALGSDLIMTNTKQCQVCQGPVKQAEHIRDKVCCPTCMIEIKGKNNGIKTDRAGSLSS